jgi:hypothetical protein
MEICPPLNKLEGTSRKKNAMLITAPGVVPIVIFVLNTVSCQDARDWLLSIFRSTCSWRISPPLLVHFPYTILVLMIDRKHGVQKVSNERPTLTTSLSYIVNGIPHHSRFNEAMNTVEYRTLRRLKLGELYKDLQYYISIYRPCAANKVPRMNGTRASRVDIHIRDPPPLFIGGTRA